MNISKPQSESNSGNCSKKIAVATRVICVLVGIAVISEGCMLKSPRPLKKKDGGVEFPSDPISDPVADVDSDPQGAIQPRGELQVRLPAGTCCKTNSVLSLQLSPRVFTTTSNDLVSDSRIRFTSADTVGRRVRVRATVFARKISGGTRGGVTFAPVTFTKAVQILDRNLQCPQVSRTVNGMAVTELSAAETSTLVRPVAAKLKHDTLVDLQLATYVRFQVCGKTVERKFVRSAKGLIKKSNDTPPQIRILFVGPNAARDAAILNNPPQTTIFTKPGTTVPLGNSATINQKKCCNAGIVTVAVDATPQVPTTAGVAPALTIQAGSMIETGLAAQRGTVGFNCSVRGTRIARRISLAGRIDFNAITNYEDNLLFNQPGYQCLPNRFTPAPTTVIDLTAAESTAIVSALANLKPVPAVNSPIIIAVEGFVEVDLEGKKVVRRYTRNIPTTVKKLGTTLYLQPQ